MCGITGIWHLNPKEHNSTNSIHNIKNMLRQIIHRGPDHQAIWKHEQQGMYIGHARLKVNVTPNTFMQLIF